MKFDLRKYTAKVKRIAQIQREGLGNILKGNNLDFVRNSQVYLASRMQQALKDGGGPQEGQTATIRGQEWAGWATRPGHAGSPAESTRYYYRRFARGSVSKKAGATWGREERKEKAGTGAWEKVWRQRASNKPYSDSSKLMQDTGRLRASLVLMKTTITMTAVELRPGDSMPNYFGRQNQLRPIWVLEPAVDKPVIVGYAQGSLYKVAKSIQDA